MTSILNYIIEANISLILALVFYIALLKNETHFRLMRVYLLMSVGVSLLLPFISIASPDSAPLSIGQIIPTYWLPEVVVGADSAQVQNNVPVTFWKGTTVLYSVGFLLCLALMSYQLVQLYKIIRRSETYRSDGLRIAESPADLPTFSFFNFIFIGKSHELTAEEKQQIIRHERVHVQQLHSFDILLLNVLSIVFWFNPFIRVYKKYFIQLHEFEADARAVENSDVNKYCNLLARVALQSADFRLANHFNNSLTVKRIEMMRTIKKSVKQWKLIAVAMVIAFLFVFVACQDQIGAELKDITKNSSHALIVPEQIQDRYEKLKKDNPGKNFALLEMNETATQKLQEMERTYGLPTTMEVFTVNDGVVSPGVTGSSAAGISIRKSGPTPEGQQTFAIIEFTQQVGQLSEAAAGPDKVYTVVEHQPEYAGGYDAMIQFIRNNLRYPAEARQQGVEGTVYASFIVEKDGAISNVKVVRGISPACDQEVMRIVKLMPNWTPAKQSGEVVRVQFVLPIKFSLGK